MAELSLNGTTYTLAYKPWGVIRRMHQEQGVDLLTLLADEHAADKMTEPGTLPLLLWGALIHAHPEMTVTQVEGMLGLGNVGVVSAAIATAIKESMEGPGVAANPTT